MGRLYAEILAGDRADICADVAGSQVAFLNACGPSAKLFDAPWVVQDASESFHGRSGRYAFHADLLPIHSLKFAKVAHTVARHPPASCPDRKHPQLRPRDASEHERARRWTPKTDLKEAEGTVKQG